MMTHKNEYDAVVVGAGPNGLAAAITIAQTGRSVLLLEARDTIGGGMRSAELTLPGFIHDICSAVHPLAQASPFFSSLSLDVEWIHPTVPLAHPLDNASAAILSRDVTETAASLDGGDPGYESIMRPLVEAWEDLIPAILAPLRPNRHPLLMARFGLQALRSTTGLAATELKGPQSRALFAGMAGHSILPLEAYGTASFGLMLGILAHAVGWPVAAGGSGKIAKALGSHFESLGGQIETNVQIQDLDEIPPADAVLLDVTPRQLLKMARDRLPERYARQMLGYRYGPGVFKMDWALEEAIPWADSRVAEAATVHVGGTIEEIAASERLVWAGEHPEQPFVLLAQPSLFDPGRAPEGKHTAWAYCHVPHGSNKDMTHRIESQIERFAPGFRDLILARHTFNSQQIQGYNANYIGGDINGGVQDLRQNIFRPIPTRNPYGTPLDGIFLCSSSTPPGGGVHGMCGFHAAQAALRTTRKR